MRAFPSCPRVANSDVPGHVPSDYLLAFVFSFQLVEYELDKDWEAASPAFAEVLDAMALLAFNLRGDESVQSNGHAELWEP